MVNGGLAGEAGGRRGEEGGGEAGVGVNKGNNSSNVE